MSRCFPFPPPGYEKKTRPDDDNLLAKEKHKEKRHKKDKKDREKREGKERSEEKHREKKDRKEKHKDKKEKRKDKDDNKHKDREKKKSSDDKNITVAPPEENRNGENLSVSTTTTTDDTTEFKFLFELGKRNRDDDRAMENHMVQKIDLTGQRTAELLGNVVGQRRAELPGNVVCQRTAELSGNVVESNTAGLGRGNEFVNDKREEDNGKNQKQSTKDMEIESVKHFTGVVEKRTEEKEKSKRKHSSDSKGDKHKDRDREKKSKSKDKKREKKEKEEKAKEKKPDKDQQQLKPIEMDKDAEELCDIRPSQQSSGIILGKRKEPEINGFLHENDNRPNKLPRPASSLHQIVENGIKPEPSKSAAKSLPERKGIVNNLKTNGVNLFSTLQVADNGKKTESSVSQGTGNNHKVDNKVSPSPSNLENERKPEHPQTSTRLPEQYVNHNFDNKVPLSLPVLENGRKLEPCQTASQLSSGKPGIGVNRKGNQRIRNGINGLTEVQEPSACFTKSSTRAKENIVEAPPVKPPHPDSKYLSQILAVPRVDWSDFDDQEWLFGNKDSQNAKKPRSSSSQAEAETRVWAEALRVESADITALPYVIPY